MSVKFRDKMIEVGSEAKFRFGGEVQHYRMPHEIWRDRLEKVAALGLDTVGCYFGWNYHSKAPGKYDFQSPDRNLQNYCDTLKAAGLLLEARPGPFLCNEWDLGGFPHWLLGRDKNWRIGEKNHLANCAEWFRAVNAILARNQYPDGPIVLYQLENEHFHGDRELYEFLRDEARRNGITVPLISNGGGSVYRCGATGITDAMDMYTTVYEYYRWRGWFDVLYRMLPPEAPMMMLEYRAGNHPPWGGKLFDEVSYPTEWMLTQTRMMIGMGANFVNPFVICGGMSPVNFAADHTCTNYGEDTAVNHWGGLNPRFYGYRLLVLSGNSVAAELGEAKPVAVGFGSTNAHVECFVRRGPRGTFLFPINLSSDEEEACLTPGDGRKLGPVRLRGRTSQLLFADLELTPELKLDFCSFEVLNLRRDDQHVTLVVHAPTGQTGFAEFSGERFEFTARPEPQRLTFAVNGVEIDCFVVDRATAERTWFAPDGTPIFSNLDLLRPDGIRAELPAAAALELVLPVERAARVDGSEPEFQPAGAGLHRARLTFPAAPEPKFTLQPPELSAGLDRWTVGDVSDWAEVTPWQPGAIGETGEYCFRLDFDAGEEPPARLEFPAVTSSETVFFLNGVQLGVFPERRLPGFPGLPSYTSSFDLGGIIRPGRNQLAVVCNVYGRHNHGRPIYAGMRVPPTLGMRTELALPRWTEALGDPTKYDFSMLEKQSPSLDGLNCRELDLNSYHTWPGENLDSDWMRARHYRTVVELPDTFREGVLYLDLGNTNWTVVYVNGEYLGEAGSDNSGWLDLSRFAGCRRLELQLAVVNYWTYPWQLTVPPKLVHYPRALTGPWKVARAEQAQEWSAFLPPAATPRARQLRCRARVDVQLPPEDEFAAPVYLELGEDWQRHAVIYWNGRAVGRYADVGPDRKFHLVREWIKPEGNCLEILLDGYSGAAQPGSIHFGVYQLQRKLKLELV